MKNAGIAVAVLFALALSVPATICADDLEEFFGIITFTTFALDYSTETTLKNSKKVKGAGKTEETSVFIRTNIDNLAQDCARGGGEYLASLGNLLGVSKERYPSFSRAVQRDFPLIFPPGESDPDMVLRRLTQRAAGPGSASF